MHLETSVIRRVAAVAIVLTALALLLLSSRLPSEGMVDEVVRRLSHAPSETQLHAPAVEGR